MAARRAKVHSVSLRLSIQRPHSKPSNGRVNLRAKDGEEEPFPVKEAFVENCTIDVDGNAMRLEIHGKRWVLDSGTSEDFRGVYVTNDEGYRSIVSVGDSTTGRISKKPVCIEFMVGELYLPIKYFLGTLSMDGLVPASQPKDDLTFCLKSKNERQSFIFRNDMALTQKTSQKKPAEKHRRMDISYNKDATFGWVPSQWNIAILRRDATARSSSIDVVVDDCKINTEINRERFSIQFPKDLRVVNLDSNDLHIAKADGTLVPGP